MNKLIITLIICLVFACEGIESEDNPRTEEPTPVITGITNDDMFYREFDPELCLDISWSNCGIGVGMDSIDLDQDNISDLYLDITLLNSELFFSSECCPPPMDCVPIFIWYKIYGSSDVDIASYYEIWDDDLLWSYADTIPEGYQIDTISDWENSTKLWCIDTPVSSGAWYNLTKDMYLGIRIGDSINYKYGWIRVSSNNNNLLFKAYSIEN